MKVLAINGSPRKTKNTAVLLGHALKGAESVGAETEMIHLIDYNFKGCNSCFACKLKDGPFYGKCALKDDLTPILEKSMKSDAIIIGSPIYFADVTSLTRAYMERLFFMNLFYGDTRTVFKGRIDIRYIYTMGIPKEQIDDFGYRHLFQTHQMFSNILNGYSEYMISADTYQFEDYSKYDAPMFNEEYKAEVRRLQFPRDCKQAYELGSFLKNAR
ncbi:flavodoxin family protein [Selenomonadales bacterium OttesenSCG-928-I06]|nr:flavodoxin family protein [Selenomonadales bacterium OttesenSCG-928-I06]